MSLVPFNNGNGQWDVVLQDSSRQAVVLYDRISHRMTLVNNARVLSTIEIADNSSGSRERCVNCGQMMTSEVRGRQQQQTNIDHVHYSNHNEDEGASIARNRRGSPIVSRDANYFQLLGYRNELEDAEEESGTNQGREPSSPIVFTPVDTPGTTPQRVASPSVSPIPGERRGSGISGSAFSQGYFDK